MHLDKARRLAIFLERLAAAEPAGTFHDAMVLIAATLNGVEDEFTSIEFDPAQWQSDGRMYPPREDSARDVPGREDVTRFRSVRHNIWVATYGAILIRTLDGEQLLDIPGRNGRKVEL